MYFASSRKQDPKASYSKILLILYLEKAKLLGWKIDQWLSKGWGIKTGVDRKGPTWKKLQS